MHVQKLNLYFLCGWQTDKCYFRFFRENVGKCLNMLLILHSFCSLCKKVSPFQTFQSMSELIQTESRIDSEHFANFDQSMGKNL